MVYSSVSILWLAEHTVSVNDVAKQFACLACHTKTFENHHLHISIYGYYEESESHAYLLYVLALSSVTTGAAVSRS